ncbi:MAG: cation diffusion facilitator family transporter [Candidatus Poribacteria bacterium]|nr:cation diffusion facilitator family transporter [Candidatus Poribacteria bacterium]
MHNHSHDHHHPHGDGHAHSHQTHLQKKFKFAVVVTFCVFLGELIGGIWSGSLALLSDAMHVMSDVFSLLISWLAIYLSTRPATASRTYGYHRAEVFAALVNGVSLIAISCWIFYEAYQRYTSPTEIKVTGMFIVACLGFVGNLLILWQLHGGSNNEWHGNLNVRSAMLHVIGDTLSSVAVVVGGAIIYWTGWYPIDALLSFLIGGIILLGAVNVTREAVHILLENSPRNADAQTVATHLQGLDPVKDVHDLHIWSLCSNYCALSAHIVVDENTTLAPDRILEQINAELQTHFGISHTTLQLEQVACAQAGNLLCNAQHS